MKDNTLVAARLVACAKARYLAPALFGLNLQSSAEVDGLAVDEKHNCYYNQECLTELKAWEAPQLGGMLVHEVWHGLRRHFVRQRLTVLQTYMPPENLPDDLQILLGRAVEPWNIAADLAINGGMLRQGFKLPNWGVWPAKFGWPEDETTEQYFERLQQATKKDIEEIRKWVRQTGIPIARLAKLFNRMPDEADPDLRRKLQERSIAQRLLDQSRQSGKGIGTMPNDQLRWAGEQLDPPKVRWQDELRNGLVGLLNRGVGDYSWRRINRRKQEGDIIFPGLAARRPSVCIVEDTSGSMGSPELAAARAETAGILRTLQASVTVLCCDAAIAGGVQKIYNIKQLRLVGGGGTDMTLGLTVASQLKPMPEVIVCLTDGITGWPDKPPSKSKFITVLVGSGQGPTFGKVIRAV